MGFQKAEGLLGQKARSKAKRTKPEKLAENKSFPPINITAPPEGKIITEVIVTADREFRKAEKKRFKTELKDAKKERALKAKEHDRENSPGQNGEDF